MCQLNSGDYPDPEDDGAVYCESCGANLDVDPCTCGPAGPRVEGVWTAENFRNSQVVSGEEP